MTDNAIKRYREMNEMRRRNINKIERPLSGTRYEKKLDMQAAIEMEDKKNGAINRKESVISECYQKWNEGEKEGSNGRRKRVRERERNRARNRKRERRETKIGRTRSFQGENSGGVTLIAVSIRT